MIFFHFSVTLTKCSECLRARWLNCTSHRIDNTGNCTFFFLVSRYFATLIFLNNLCLCTNKKCVNEKNTYFLRHFLFALWWTAVLELPVPDVKTSSSLAFDFLKQKGTHHTVCCLYFSTVDLLFWVEYYQADAATTLSHISQPWVATSGLCLLFNSRPADNVNREMLPQKGREACGGGEGVMKKGWRLK